MFNSYVSLPEGKLSQLSKQWSSSIYMNINMEKHPVFTGNVYVFTHGCVPSLFQLVDVVESKVLQFLVPTTGIGLLF